MMQQNWIFFRLLLNKYFPQKADALFQLLQDEKQKEEMQKGLAECTLASKNPECLIFKPEEKLQELHYSWLEPILLAIDEPLRSSIILAMPAATISALMKREVISQDFENKTTNLSKSVQSFLLGKLFAKWQELSFEKETMPLPKELLPKTDLDPLLSASKTELTDLIDLLSMHDLAAEVRHIVDKKLLHAIISKLTVDQQKYLRTTLHQKPKMQEPPLQVREIYKDSKKFLHTLHKRGLKRLGSALSGLSPDFIWYITHTLDVGRGKLLMSFIQKEEIPTATQVVKIQILQIQQLLKAKESK